MPAHPEDVMEEFKDFDELPKSIIPYTKEVTLWPLHERIAHDTWHKGRVVLLGDACHPMRPHMMSGASMAIEDAVILTRCLEKTGIHDFPKAFTRYKELRFDRISKVQRISSINTWLQKETDDPAWLFEYDPYQIEI